MSEPLLISRGLFKRYDGGAQSVEVLKGVDFQMDRGALVGVYGASGAGKSTLLHILGGLDVPTAGTVELMGKDVARMSEPELARMRNRRVGFVFQFYHLLSEFAAVENIMIPCLVAGVGKQRARELSRAALERVGLSDRANHRPAELSGGEQQRVAIARAAVMEPDLILADEPTGNLDRHTGKRVWEYLLRLREEAGVGMVVVSHNHDLLKDISIVHELKDGTLHLLGG